MNIEEIMNKAVDKFLGWELPDFYPDGGITFKRIPNHKVTGTNLFSAQEAKQMFEYALTEALTTHTNALRIKLLEEVKSIKKPIPATHVCFESNITFVEETPASFMGALCLEGKITEQHALEIKNIIAAVIATSVRKERERVIKKLVDDGYLLGSEDVLKELSELNPPPSV